MTNDMMALKGFVERTSDSDIWLYMISFTAERLMALEVSSFTGASYHEKTGDRLGQCNLYRDRDWDSLAGTVDLRIPKLRLLKLRLPKLHKGRYFPAFFAARRGAEKALRALSRGPWGSLPISTLKMLQSASGFAGMVMKTDPKKCAGIFALPVAGQGLATHGNKHARIHELKVQKLRRGFLHARDNLRDWMAHAARLIV